MDNHSIIVYVSGPSGVGKTTLVKKLAHIGQAYIEEVHANPHFSVAPGTFGPTDVFRSQLWFLDEICGFVTRCANSKILVIDQAPAATVEVYARFALMRGSLSPNQFKLLCGHLKYVESVIAPCHRIELILRASASVLFQRAVRRDGVAPDVNLERFEEIVCLFADYSIARKNAVLIDTDSNDTESVYGQAMRAIQEGRKEKLNGSIG